MRTIIRTLAVIMASVVPALAAGSGKAQGDGLLLYLFLGFGALIIVFQFTPGIVMFARMVKEMFMRSPKKTPGAITGPSKGR